MMRGHSEATSGHLRSEGPRGLSADETRDVGDLVQEIVARLVPHGSPDVKSVAEMVQVSARTLQRRLLDEGRSFADLLAQTRRQLAQQMLEDPVRKIVDVALDLGYSDHAHFTRAFVRWTGESPRDFRRRRSASASARPTAVSQTRGGLRAELARTRQGTAAAARQGETR